MGMFSEGLGAARELRQPKKDPMVEALLAMAEGAEYLRGKKNLTLFKDERCLKGRRFVVHAVYAYLAPEVLRETLARAWRVTHESMVGRSGPIIFLTYKDVVMSITPRP